MSMNKKILVSLVFIGFIPLLSGCSILDKSRRADRLERENAQLRSQLDDLKEEKDQELERARKDLAKTLEKELGEYKAKLEMTERGLVITFLAEIFFDSGKDVLRTEGKPVLEKVAKILNKDVINSNIAIEGHTDSDPIKYSGWKSNWELSSGRAMAVLHYFIDACDIKPERLSANAYGEFRPVTFNDTPAGKQKNRRVEIVIFPSQLKKVKP